MKPTIVFLVLSCAFVYACCGSPTGFKDVTTEDGCEGFFKGSVHKADLTEAKTMFAGCAIDSYMFWAGGYENDGWVNQEVEIWEALNNGVLKLFQIERLPAKAHSLAGASCKGEAFFGGGFDGDYALDQVAIYSFDSSKSSWYLSSNETLSVARSLLAAASSNEFVYFAGGYSISVGYSDVIDIFNVVSRVWMPVLHLSLGRYSLSLVVAGSKLLAAGGWNNNGTQDIVDVYSIPQHQPLSSLKLDKPRMGMASTACSGETYGDVAFFAGGWKQPSFSEEIDGNPWTSVVDTFIEGESDRIWHLALNRSYVAGASIGDFVYFFSGNAPGNYFPPICDAVNVKDEEYCVLNFSNGAMQSVGLSANGIVAFAGGRSTNGAVSTIQYIVVEDENPRHQESSSCFVFLSLCAWMCWLFVF